MASARKIDDEIEHSARNHDTHSVANKSKPGKKSFIEDETN